MAIWFSSAAYCDKDTYLTRTWLGPTAGFKATKVIYDRKTDTNGYVGYLASTKEIYVVYRGSQTLKNWITNLQFAKADYAYPGCPSCLVHKGFYEAEQAVIGDVLAEVSRLSKQYNTKTVVSTGHSLGAALATLTGLDLKRNGYNVIMYNIGSPRVGDVNFANHAKAQLPDIHRIVHDDDMVAHVPLQSMNFNHVAYEYFEDKNGAVRRCDPVGSKENENCGNQYRLAQTSVEAHSWYLGLNVGCESVSTEVEAAAHRVYMASVEQQLQVEGRSDIDHPILFATHEE